VRHVEVEQDQVRHLFDGAADGFDAIRRFDHHVALGFEHGGQTAAHERVVVGNQDAVVNGVRGLGLSSSERQRCAGEGGRPLKERTTLPGGSVIAGRGAAKFPASAGMAEQVGLAHGSEGGPRVPARAGGDERFEFHGVAVEGFPARGAQKHGGAARHLPGNEDNPGRSAGPPKDLAAVFWM